MRCERAQVWLTARRDGELPGWRVWRLDRHLARCPACRVEDARGARLAALLGALPRAAEVSERLAQDTFRAVRLLAAEEEERRAARVGGRWASTLLPVAAATAVVVLAMRFGATSEPGTHSTRVAVAATAPAPVRTAARRADERPAVARAGTRREPPTAIADVPPELLRAPDLYASFGVVRHFDKLQHFDELRAAVEAAPADARPRTDG